MVMMMMTMIVMMMMMVTALVPRLGRAYGRLDQEVGGPSSCALSCASSCVTQLCCLMRGSGV